MSIMSHELATVPARTPGVLELVRGLAAASASVDLYTAVLAGRNARTVRAYEADYRDFARFLGVPSPTVALEALVALGQGEAHAVALSYRAHLVGRGLAPATIRRRLVALRGAVKLARQLGRLGWSLEVEAPRTEAYRDTTGPGLEGWRQLLAAAVAGATTPKGKRDLALIRMMHDLGMRRGEAVSLDLADVDLEGGTVAVIGKGKLEAKRMTLNAPAREALARWLAVHPDPRPDAPVFVRLDPAALEPTRLTGDNVARMVRALGGRVALPRRVRPHGLRHQAISRILELTNGNIEAAQGFARHSDPKTTMKYNDNRKDVAGQMARMLGDDG
jgi:integrase/recombinase XerC